MRSETYHVLKIVPRHQHKPLLLALMDVYHGVCQYCGMKVSTETTMPVVEHIVAISKGGSRTTSNCILSCQGCNAVKSWGRMSRTMLSAAKDRSQENADTVYEKYLGYKNQK